MDRLHEFFKKYADSPFVAVFGVLTVLTTFWGVVSIYKDVAEWGGSRAGAFVVAAVLGMLVLFVFASYLIPSVRRQYAIPFSAKYIFTEIKRTWEIDRAGNAAISTDKTYLFFDEPQDEDLHDIVLGSLNLKLEDINYKSGDSVPYDYEQVKDYMQRIYWKPKSGTISVGVPYRHNVQSKFPFPGERLPQYKVMTIVAPVSTLKVEITVKCEIPILQVVAFRERRFQKFKDVDGIARRGKSIRRTMAPLPVITDSHNLTWSIDKLPASTIYYLILYFNH